MVATGMLWSKFYLQEFEGGKNKSAKAPKSAGKKGAAKKPPEQQNSAKQGTLLKKRSEENLDQKFIGKI